MRVERRGRREGRRESGGGTLARSRVIASNGGRAGVHDGDHVTVVGPAEAHLVLNGVTEVGLKGGLVLAKEGGDLAKTELRRRRRRKGRRRRRRRRKTEKGGREEEKEKWKR